jgi:hypothetical protein
MNRYGFILIFIIFSLFSKAQNDKDIVITVNGLGKNLEEAKSYAFRSAIEQAYGSFVSSKTEMIKDEIVADEISSISSGNIKTYSILNETKLNETLWSITIKVTVSIDKLINYSKSKGFSTELDGSIFAINIKQQILNEQAEVKIINNMCSVLEDILQNCFDYKIESSNPISIDNINNCWRIPLIVTAMTNNNIYIYRKYLMETMRSISLNLDDRISYEKINKKYFPVGIIIRDSIIGDFYYLRNENSVKKIQLLECNTEKIISNFQIQPRAQIKVMWQRRIYSNFYYKKKLYNLIPEIIENNERWESEKDFPMNRDGGIKNYKPSDPILPNKEDFGQPKIQKKWGPEPLEPYYFINYVSTCDKSILQPIRHRYHTSYLYLNLYNKGNLPIYEYLLWDDVSLTELEKLNGYNVIKLGKMK